MDNPLFNKSVQRTWNETNYSSPLSMPKHGQRVLVADDIGNATVAKYDSMSGDFLLDTAMLAGDEITGLAMSIAIEAVSRFFANKKSLSEKISAELRQIVSDLSDGEGDNYFQLLEELDNAAADGVLDCEPAYVRAAYFWMDFPPMPRGVSMHEGHEGFADEVHFRALDVMQEIEPSIRAAIAKAIGSPTSTERDQDAT